MNNKFRVFIISVLSYGCAYSMSDELQELFKDAMRTCLSVSTKGSISENKRDNKHFYGCLSLSAMHKTYRNGSYNRSSLYQAIDLNQAIEKIKETGYEEPYYNPDLVHLDPKINDEHDKEEEFRKKLLHKVIDEEYEKEREYGDW